MCQVQCLWLSCLFILTAANVFENLSDDRTVFLNKTDCRSSKHYCDLNVLSNGSKIVKINSPGTLWKVDELKICNLVELTLLEAAIIDESIVKACDKLKMISFKGFNYDCNIASWIKVLESISWKTIWMDVSNSNCSSLFGFDKECGNTSDFIYQMLCINTMRNFGGSPCNFSVSPRDYSIFIECTNMSLTEIQLPIQLPLRSKRLFMDGNKLTNVDEWLENVLPNLRMVEQINLSNNTLVKLPLLPETENPIEHIYIERNSLDFEFDEEAFNSYLRYEGMVLSFKRSKWNCNCKARDLVDFIIANTKIFSDWQVLFCADDKSDHQRPWTIDYSHCGGREPLDYPLFIFIPLLIVVNIIAFAIFVDLNRIICREKKGLTNRRAPWIHSIFIKITGRDRMDI